jgi:hypothetical protein
MDFAADLSLFYADFGVNASLAGHDPVPGLFDADYVDALGMVAGVHPVFRTASTGPITRGAVLTISGVSYKTKAGIPVGPDEVIWPLEKV